MLNNGAPLPLGKTFRVLRNHDFGGVEAGLPSQMEELMAPRPKTRGRSIGKAI